MERHRLPMVETRGQQRRFQSGGARALWISLIVGGIYLLSWEFSGCNNLQK